MSIEEPPIPFPVLKFEEISKDIRGANFRVILPDGREGVFIFTKAGYLRGGHQHDTYEVNMCLSGVMREHRIVGAGTMSGGQEVIQDLLPGDIVRNEIGDIHMGQAITDNWLFDWKPDLPVGAWHTYDYAPYRERVQAQFKRAPTIEDTEAIIKE